MSSKVTTTTIDMRTLCLQQNPRMYSDPEPSYEFATRKFTKPQKTNRTRDEQS